VSAVNRLTGEQLADLAPGDPVVVETGGDFRRPQQSSGTVVRVSGAHIVVSVRSARGVPYVHQFGRRDGVCTAGARRSELVNPDGLPADAPSEQRWHAARIDALYREWKRSRDGETLRQLHAAIGEHLAVELVSAADED
jgi:hypothetical protein